MPISLLGVTLLTIAIAAGRDLWRRQYRDLQHWLGVLAVFAVVAHVTVLALMAVAALH